MLTMVGRATMAVGTTEAGVTTEKTEESRHGD
jgi:hypothetical protein